MSYSHQHSNAFVSVNKSGERAGNLMYIIITERPAFDLIDLPEGGTEKVRHKVIEHGAQHIIFQFWIGKP